MALGGIVFRVESARLDHRIVYQGSEEIYALCETARWRYRGIPAELHEKARALVLHNLPWLHYARKRVLGVVSPAEDPPVASWMAS